MQPTQRIEELRLHTVEGAIWFREPGQQMQMSPLPPEEFVRQQFVLTAKSVRVLGAAANACLIAGLHTSRCVGRQPGNVWIGNPTWLALPAEEVKQADYIFHYMDGHEEAPSVGGWRRLTEKDYVTAALTSEFTASGRRCTPLVERFLRVHPSWPALSFLPDLNKVAACELITKIGDPRWHVDCRSPNRSAKLRSFLGAGDAGMADIRLILQDSKQLLASPLRSLLDTWTGGEYSPPPQDVVGPSSFLWRVYYSAAVKHGGSGGLLRACHTFLRFLSSVWMDNLTEARKYDKVAMQAFTSKHRQRPSRDRVVPKMVPCRTYSPTLFVPKYFFRLTSEVEAWRQHMEKCQGHIPR